MYRRQLSVKLTVHQELKHNIRMTDQQRLRCVALLVREQTADLLVHQGIKELDNLSTILLPVQPLRPETLPLVTELTVDLLVHQEIRKLDSQSTNTYREIKELDNQSTVLLLVQRLILQTVP